MYDVYITLKFLTGHFPPEEEMVIVEFACTTLYTAVLTLLS